MTTGTLIAMTETDDPDVAIVVAAYRAFAAGDIHSAVTDLHPDVEWIEPLEFPNGGRRVGRAAVFEYLQSSRASWRELRSTPAVSRRGERIVAVHHIEGVLVDGTPHEATVADVFTVRGEQVVHMKAYADPSEVPGLNICRPEG
ncbi:MAG TPA: nuclear transport factor 2 family protein [Jatrophihabitans sp.]